MTSNQEVHSEMLSENDKSNLLTSFSSDPTIPMNPVCLNVLLDVFIKFSEVNVLARKPLSVSIEKVTNQIWKCCIAIYSHKLGGEFNFDQLVVCEHDIKLKLPLSFDLSCKWSLPCLLLAMHIGIFSNNARRC